MFRFNLTELSDKVVFVEYYSVSKELAEMLQNELKAKGFYVILGGTQGV